ncbi:hypothetical protein ACFLZ6_01025 [Nanoarchaeota archaeon]
MTTQHSTVLKKTELVDKQSILEEIVFGVLGMASNYSSMVKDEEVMGKTVVGLDALVDKKLAETYHRLDANAFEGEAAPAYMKLDTVIMGGCPVAMMLPNRYANNDLKKEIGAEEMEYVPIAFLDLHKTGEGKFVASGLGVSKQYHGKGLSKYMIYGAAKITGMEELVIPTQVHNAAAQFAWMHLAPLTVLSADVHHEEADTIIYRANMPNPVKGILDPISKDYDKFAGKIKSIPFADVKEKLAGRDAQVIGYSPNGLLVVSYQDVKASRAA